MNNGNRVSTFSDFAGEPKFVPRRKQPTDFSRVKRAAEQVNEKAVKPAAKEDMKPEELLERANSLLNEIKSTKQPDFIEAIDESLVPKFEGYRIARDKDEVFECKISVEGTTLNEARARLVLDSEPWNLTFYGKIYPDGRCFIPIKKGLPLGEGSTGKIRLEVIAEDQLFVGWENDFLVEVSKKLNVEVKEQKKVKVSFGSVE